jgi:hypothetical protein
MSEIEDFSPEFDHFCTVVTLSHRSKILVLQENFYVSQREVLRRFSIVLCNVLGSVQKPHDEHAVL